MLGDVLQCTQTITTMSVFLKYYAELVNLHV